MYAQTNKQPSKQTAIRQQLKPRIHGKYVQKKRVEKQINRKKKPTIWIEMLHLSMHLSMHNKNARKNSVYTHRTMSLYEWNA